MSEESDQDRGPSDNQPQDSVDETVSETYPYEEADLSTSERIQKTLGATPNATDELKDEWEREPVQMYFFGYSLLAAAAMMLCLYLDKTLILYGVMGVYTLTAVPALYLYEEEGYFSESQNPFLGEDSATMPVSNNESDDPINKENQE